MLYATKEELNALNERVDRCFENLGTLKLGLAKVEALEKRLNAVQERSEVVMEHSEQTRGILRVEEKNSRVKLATVNQRVDELELMFQTEDTTDDAIQMQTLPPVKNIVSPPKMVPPTNEIEDLQKKLKQMTELVNKRLSDQRYWEERERENRQANRQEIKRLGEERLTIGEISRSEITKLENQIATQKIVIGGLWGGNAGVELRIAQQKKMLDEMQTALTAQKSTIVNLKGCLKVLREEGGESDGN